MSFSGITLVNLPFPPSGRHRSNYYRGGTYPNPSLAYLAGDLRARGHRPAVVDAKLDGATPGETLERVVASRPRVVGLTAFTTEVAAVLALAEGIRRRLPGAFLVLGGVHATALPEETLLRGAALDAVAVGEGEETLAELLERLDGRARLDVPIPGLVHRAGTELVDGGLRTPPAPRATAAFDLFAMADLCFTMTYRGCPFPCSFCFRAGGRSVRWRSLDDVMEELRQALPRSRTSAVGVIDATFAVDRGRAEAFCRRLILEGLHRRLAWRCSTRVDSVTEDLLGLMKEAGCRGVGFGIESGSDRILAQTGKHVTVDASIRAVRAAQRLGLATVSFFVLGHPGETSADVDQTVDLVARLNTTVTSVAIMSPYPGTRVFDLAVEGEGGYRLLSRDYAKYEERIADVLAFEAFDVAYLERMRRRAYLRLHLRNGRYLDLLVLLLAHRRSIPGLLHRWLGARSRGLAPPLAQNTLSWAGANLQREPPAV